MLSPKKNGNFAKKNWEDLDRYLQNSIDPSKSSSPYAIIKVSDYIMAKDDIIAEAKRNGYSVTDKGEYLEFN